MVSCYCKVTVSRYSARTVRKGAGPRGSWTKEYGGSGTGERRFAGKVGRQTWLRVLWTSTRKPTGHTVLRFPVWYDRRTRPTNRTTARLPVWHGRRTRPTNVRLHGFPYGTVVEHGPPTYDCTASRMALSHDLSWDTGDPYVHENVVATNQLPL
jgi:hypothetical protein